MVGRFQALFVILIAEVMNGAQMIVIMVRIARMEMIVRRSREGNQQRKNQTGLEREPHWSPVWHACPPT